MRSIIFIALFHISSSASALSYAQTLDTDKLAPYQKGFLSALEKDQKKLYKEESWDRFFGNALFYRAHFLKDKQSVENNFIESLVALELIAYGKHCDWDSVNQIALSIENKLNSRTKKVFTKILKKINLLKTIPQKQNKLEDINFKKKALWKLNDTAIKKVRHPKTIIYRVKNKCE